MKKIFETLKKSKKAKIISITFVSVCVLVIAIIILFNLNTNPIIGRWCYSEGRAICYNFNADKTGTYGTINNENNFQYTTENNILHVDYDSDNITMADVTYRIENGTLILTTKEGNEVKYIKEEPETEQLQESQEKQDERIEDNEDAEINLEEEEKREEELHEQEHQEHEE